MFFIKHIIIFALFVFNTAAIAQVDFSQKHVIDNVVLYRDGKIKSHFYYAPYGLQLVKNKEGKPDFKFIQMRYTGTRLSGDQGSVRFRSLLRFKVANHVPSKAIKDRIKKIMRRKGIYIRNLRPLPIHDLSATLIYNTINDTVTKAYSGGFFEGDETVSANAYWTERDFVLRLSNEDAQLLYTTFKSGQPGISFHYTYSAKGLNSMKNEIVVSGSGDIGKKMKARLKQEKGAINKVLTEKIVVSGALTVTIDSNTWPDLIKQVDINERIPPEYAALDVYCFDFNNELHKELYAKKVEIKAEGVSGKDVVFNTTFKAATPDIYARTIRFAYAVKPDMPYFYRITKIFKDGSWERSDWKTVANWHQILDITGYPQHKN